MNLDEKYERLEDLRLELLSLYEHIISRLDEKGTSLEELYRIYNSEGERLTAEMGRLLNDINREVVNSGE